MIGAILFFLLTGLLFVLLSIPMIKRRVKPNAWYGFRIPETTDNPEIWYPANVYAGKGLRISGLLTMIASLITLLIPGLTFDGYAMVVMGVMLAGVLMTLALSIRYAKVLAAEMDDPAGPK